VLELFERRGVPIGLQGVERLIAACARDDATAIRAITADEPAFVGELLAEGGTLLAEFAAAANVEGVGRLLDLGVDVARSTRGTVTTAWRRTAWRCTWRPGRLGPRSRSC
jgi:hypothetical protein